MKAVQKVFNIGIVLSLGLPGLAWAQVNISGKPGLIYIPSAEVVADGTFSFGYGFNPSSYAFRFSPQANPLVTTRNSESIAFVNLVVFPRLEVNINLLLPNGPIQYSAKGIGDRQIDIKYALLTEKAKRPSVAVIISAPFGIDNSLITNVVVATKHVNISKSITTAFTLGMSSPYSLYRAEVKNDKDSDIFSGYTLKDKRDKPNYYLAGPFGGVNLNVNKKGGFMVEWDSQHVNVGAYALLFKHWTVQAGLLNGDQVTASTSYAIPLLRKPKRP
ncbi:YjbH domain-containing protein [Spirosoma radiotolerans]|uniref:YjbH domain-containing protein n=1 Tax=Spirosoma radiotolerans TaxID=1379870 RepID=UPI001D12F77A|nr:YjbH domain-containing protein [Spirosoma radiotolerans]